MNIIIKAHHIEITDALKEYAQKKIDKVEHFFDQIQHVTINLNIEGTHSLQESQVASAIIKSSGAVITAKEKSPDMYSSIDLLIDKLVVQLKKYKEKLKKHKGNLPLSNLSTKPPTVKKKEESIQRYIPKPMGPEDAVLILEEKHLNFLVFRDLKERVCVIYRTDSGEYELIET
tara:strand:- start:103 stop:624 length:522 start_codon:yes stop_codon:yes gene_type:complete